MKNRILKTIACITVSVFTFTTIAWSDGGSLVYKMRVPADEGKVKERWKPPHESSPSPAGSEQLPTVVLIQDAHTSLDAQENIARIIETLVKQTQKSESSKPRQTPSKLGGTTPIVCVEGAAGPCSLDLFRSFPDDEVKRLVGERFLARGKFTGAEYAALVSEKPFVLEGAEERALYQENYEAYFTVLSRRDELLEAIGELEGLLADVSAAHCSPAFTDIIKTLQPYRETNHDVFACALDLFSIAQEVDYDLYQYPNAQLFYEALQKEKYFNKEYVSTEYEELRTVCQEQGIDTTGIEKNTKNTGSERERYCLMRNIIQEHGLSPHRFSNIVGHANYLEALGRVNIERLLYELRSIRWGIEEASAKNEEERHFAELQHSIELLRILLTLEAVTDDSAYFYAHTERFTRTHIEELIAAVIGKERAANISLATYDAVLSGVEHFYACADERSRALVKNTLVNNDISAQLRDVVFLVAGGYHTPGITQELRDQNIPYVVISPEITDPTRMIPYEDRMLMRETPFERMVWSSIGTSTMAYQLLSADVPLVEWRGRLSPGGIDTSEITPTASPKAVHEEAVCFALYVMGFIKFVCEKGDAPIDSKRIPGYFVTKANKVLEEQYKKKLEGWDPIEKFRERIHYLQEPKITSSGEHCVKFLIADAQGKEETYEINLEEFFTDFDTALSKAGDVTTRDMTTLTHEELSTLYLMVYKHFVVALPTEGEAQQDEGVLSESEPEREEVVIENCHASVETDVAEGKVVFDIIQHPFEVLFNTPFPEDMKSRIEIMKQHEDDYYVSDEQIEDEVVRFKNFVDEMEKASAALEGLNKEADQMRMVVDILWKDIQKMFCDPQEGLIVKKRMKSEYLLFKYLSQEGIEIVKGLDGELPEKSQRVEKMIKVMGATFGDDFTMAIYDSIFRLKENLSYRYEQKSEDATILVVSKYTPQRLQEKLIQYPNVKAIISDLGTNISHWIFMADGYEIPVVFGVKINGKSLHQIAREGDDVKITIEENKARIMLNPFDGEKEKFQIAKAQIKVKKKKYDEIKNEVPITHYGKKLSIRLNVDDDEAVNQKQQREEESFTQEEKINLRKYVERRGAKGIGLVRTEYWYAKKDPKEESLIARILRLTESTDDVLTIRLIDYQPDKIKRPDWGAHYGCDFYATEKGMNIVRTQIRAILKAQYLSGNVRILVPAIESEEGLDTILKIINEEKGNIVEELKNEKDQTEKGDQERIVDEQIINIQKIRIGFMIERKEVVLHPDLLRNIIEKADFLSIGSNDLTKYLLNVDRDADTKKADYYFTKLHPKILRAIQRIFASVKASRKKPEEVCVCGELGHDKPFILFLLSLLRESDIPISVSVKLPKILPTKAFIRSIQEEDIEKVAASYFETLSNPESGLYEIEELHNVIDAVVKEVDYRTFHESSVSQETIIPGGRLPWLAKFLAERTKWSEPMREIAQILFEQALWLAAFCMALTVDKFAPVVIVVWAFAFAVFHGEIKLSKDVRWVTEVNLLSHLLAWYAASPPAIFSFILVAAYVHYFINTDLRPRSKTDWRNGKEFIVPTDEEQRTARPLFTRRTFVTTSLAAVVSLASAKSVFGQVAVAASQVFAKAEKGKLFTKDAFRKKKGIQIIALRNKKSALYHTQLINEVVMGMNARCDYEKDRLYHIYVNPVCGDDVWALYEPLLKKIENISGLSRENILHTVMKESGGVETARSSAGAMGIMQTKEIAINDVLQDKKKEQVLVDRMERAKGKLEKLEDTSQNATKRQVLEATIENYSNQIKILKLIDPRLITQSFFREKDAKGTERRMRLALSHGPLNLLFGAAYKGIKKTELEYFKTLGKLQPQNKEAIDKKTEVTLATEIIYYLGEGNFLPLVRKQGSWAHIFENLKKKAAAEKRRSHRRKWEDAIHYGYTYILWALKNSNGTYSAHTDYSIHRKWCTSAFVEELRRTVEHHKQSIGKAQRNHAKENEIAFCNGVLKLIKREYDDKTFNALKANIERLEKQHYGGPTYLLHHKLMGFFPYVKKARDTDFTQTPKEEKRPAVVEKKNKQLMKEVIDENRKVREALKEKEDMKVEEVGGEPDMSVRVQNMMLSSIVGAFLYGMVKWHHRRERIRQAEKDGAFKKSMADMREGITEKYTAIGADRATIKQRVGNALSRYAEQTQMYNASRAMKRRLIRGIVIGSLIALSTFIHATHTLMIGLFFSLFMIAGGAYSIMRQKDKSKMYKSVAVVILILSALIIGIAIQSYIFAAPFGIMMNGGKLEAIGEVMVALCLYLAFKVMAITGEAITRTEKHIEEMTDMDVPRISLTTDDEEFLVDVPDAVLRRMEERIQEVEGSAYQIKKEFIQCEVTYSDDKSQIYVKFLYHDKNIGPRPICIGDLSIARVWDDPSCVEFSYLEIPQQANITYYNENGRLELYGGYRFRGIGLSDFFVAHTLSLLQKKGYRKALLSIKPDTFKKTPDENQPIEKIMNRLGIKMNPIDVLYYYVHDQTLRRYTKLNPMLMEDDQWSEDTVGAHMINLEEMEERSLIRNLWQTTELGKILLSPYLFEPMRQACIRVLSGVIPLNNTDRTDQVRAVIGDHTFKTREALSTYLNDALQINISPEVYNDSDAVKLTVMCNDKILVRMYLDMLYLRDGERNVDVPTGDVYLPYWTTELRNKGIGTVVLKEVCSLLRHNGYRYVYGDLENSKSIFEKGLNLTVEHNKPLYGRDFKKKNEQLTRLYAKTDGTLDVKNLVDRVDIREPVYVFINEDVVNEDTACDFNKDALNQLSLVVNVQPIFFSFTKSEEAIKAKLEDLGITESMYLKVFGNVQSLEGKDSGEKFATLLDAHNLPQEPQRLIVIDKGEDGQSMSEFAQIVWNGKSAWIGLINPDFEYKNIFDLEGLITQGKMPATIMAHITYFLGKIQMNETPEGSEQLSGAFISMSPEIQKQLEETLSEFKKKRMIKKAA